MVNTGYYAFEIFDENYEHVGFHLVQVTKAGHIRISHRPLDGTGFDTLMAALDYEREEFGDRHFLDYVDDDILGPAGWAAYGKLTGKCGCCGRKLTDPASIHRGIGPECAKA